MPRQLLLDYGQVISSAQEPADVAALAELAGLPVARLAERYWGPRVHYDRGGSAAAYWAAVCGAEPDEGLLRRLVELDTRSWLRLDPAALAVLDELRAAGVELSLLSNAPRELALALGRHPVLDGFRQLLFSAELGMVKPDPRIFVLAAERLGTAPDEIVFVDDRAENVRAAAEVGMHAVHYRGAADALRALPLDAVGPDAAGPDAAGSRQR